MNRKAKGRADVNAPDDNNANKSCVLGLFRVAFARSSPVPQPTPLVPAEPVPLCTIRSVLSPLYFTFLLEISSTREKLGGPD